MFNRNGFNMITKHNLPLFANLNLAIDIEKLRAEVDTLATKYVDVRTANPNLCMNHKELVNDVYDNFEQINLTTPSEILDFEPNIKKRLRRREEHLYNVPTPEYTGSYIESIVTQCKSKASRIRITKLAHGKVIPLHVDYDVSYGVRVIIPVYTSEEVTNIFKKDGTIESCHLEAGNAYFLNIGFPHGVNNNSAEPRIALMFTLDGVDDIEHL
jgi:hypothetical protein